MLRPLKYLSKTAAPPQQYGSSYDYYVGTDKPKGIRIALGRTIPNPEEPLGPVTHSDYSHTETSQEIKDWLVNSSNYYVGVRHKPRIDKWPWELTDEDLSIYNNDYMAFRDPRETFGIAQRLIYGGEPVDQVVWRDAGSGRFEPGPGSSYTPRHRYIFSDGFARDYRYTPEELAARRDRYRAARALFIHRLKAVPGLLNYVGVGKNRGVFGIDVNVIPAASQDAVKSHVASGGITIPAGSNRLPRLVQIPRVGDLTFMRDLYKYATYRVVRDPNSGRFRLMLDFLPSVYAAGPDTRHAYRDSYESGESAYPAMLRLRRK